MANEKLVPFNLEEARKDPSRVRYIYKPEAPYDLVEFTERGAVIGWRGPTANVYPPSAQHTLQLVAKPVEHRYHPRKTSQAHVWLCDDSQTLAFPDLSQRFIPSAVRIEADGTIVVTE